VTVLIPALKLDRLAGELTYCRQLLDRLDQIVSVLRDDDFLPPSTEGASELAAADVDEALLIAEGLVIRATAAENELLGIDLFLSTGGAE